LSWKAGTSGGSIILAHASSGVNRRGIALFADMTPFIMRRMDEAAGEDAMALCPRCNQRLARVPTPQGIVFQCPACKGRAVGVAVLRRLVPAGLVQGLWLMLQCWLAVEQMWGMGNVSALAHLGGFAVGVVAWMLWRMGHAPPD
jgi:hypothetical protein